MAIRVGRGLLALAALSGLTAILSTACVEDEAAFVVRQAQVPSEENCAFDVNAEAALASGFVDVGLTRTYQAGLLLENDLVPQKDDQNLKSETARITVYEAEITLEDENGEVDSYEWPATGFLPADSPGFGVSVVPLIRSQIGAQLEAELAGNRQARKELLATVVMRGRTTGGNELETPEWSFPITACWGCLVSFGQETVDSESGDPCTADPEGDVACLVGQDRSIGCNECQGYAACDPSQ